MLAYIVAIMIDLILIYLIAYYATHGVFSRELALYRKAEDDAKRRRRQ